MFPVKEIINPVKAGPIALDDLSVIAYNYMSEIGDKGHTEKKVLSFPEGMSSEKMALP